MAESGGPATQSGIFFQNSLAALYLGSLLDLREPAGRSRVTSVRVEAPEHVDDIVVTFADGGSLFIQAKETLDAHGEPWTKMWMAVRKQFEKSPGSQNQVHIIIGNFNKALDQLREALERARGKVNYAEWRAALAKDHEKIVDGVLSTLALSADDAFSNFKRTSVIFWPLQAIETIGVRDWIPPSSASRASLFSHLRDCCGGGARRRAVFVASELSEELFVKYRLQINGSHGDSIEKYRHAIRSQFDHISVPGTSISLQEDKLFVWPDVSSDERATHSDFEDEAFSATITSVIEKEDLREFPTSELKYGVLESGAGYGKTTILKVIARRLVTETSFVPAFLNADALQNHATIHDYLNSVLNANYQVYIEWQALSEQGRAVLLIDGIDELADEARANLLSVVDRVAARFPLMPILIGARDASVTNLPPSFKLLRIRRLDREQMIEMLEAYAEARPELDIQTLTKHVLDYQDLRLLCSVPLFLSVFVATVPLKGRIPTSRVDVLERYISHILSPQRHKGTRSSTLSATRLRKGSEVLALVALRRNESAIPEHVARGALEKELGMQDGDACVDKLLQYGILQRRASRIAFSLPTVQEYLAACALAEDEALTAQSWAENVYRRPWAQAMQFAVEKMEDSESLLRHQLGRKDDLFHTELRLIARCIVNGAAVSAAFKNEVAFKLSQAWGRGLYETRRRIGQLVLDGFCSPLHEALKTSLKEKTSFMPARGEVLCRAGDTELSLECLSSLLTQEDIRELNSDWFDALRPVAVEVVELLITRIRNEANSYWAENVVAEALYCFREDRKVDWRSIVDDEGLPSVVRAAAVFGLDKHSYVDSLRFIEAALSQSSDGYMWDSFYEAFTSIECWKDHLRALGAMPVTAGKWRLGRYLRVDLTNGKPPADLVDVLISIAEDTAADPISRFCVQIILGGLGYEAFAKLATEALSQMPVEELHSWIGECPYFPEAMAVRGFDLIRKRNLSNEETVNTVKALGYSASVRPSGKRRSLLGGGPFMRRQKPSEMAICVENWARDLIASSSYSARDKTELMLICVQCGFDSFIRELAASLEDYLKVNEVIANEDWSWFASILMEIEQHAEFVSTQFLWNAILKGGDNPVGGFVSEIIRREGIACYPALIDYFCKGSSADARYAILSHFEASAEREGLIVRVLNGCLEVTKA